METTFSVLQSGSPASLVQKKILIASPLKQKVEIFLEHQESIKKLNVPEGYQVDTYYIVNDCDEIVPHLKDCYFTVYNGLADSHFDNSPHVWSSLKLRRMVLMRNLCINFAKTYNYDYLFMVDTDLVLHPDTLLWLLSANKDIIGEAFFTSIKHDDSFFANAWMYDYGIWDNDYFVEIMRTCRTKDSKVYEVNAAGACLLISKKVLDAGVDYSIIPILPNKTEDEYFCVRALANGFKIYLDNHCSPIHLYDDYVYQEYIKNGKTLNEFI